jgi:hypothetical protein
MNDTQKFHKLTPAECRQMYASRLIDTSGYILLIIKTHGAAGWKWGISAREFCREWGIKIRTFYVAIKRLVESGLIEAKRRSDILLSYKTVPDTTIASDAHTYSPDCTTVQHDCTQVQHDAKTEAETVTQQDFQNVPDFIQTSSDFESEEEEEQTAPCGGAVCQEGIKEEEIKEEEYNRPEIKLTDEELAIAAHEAEGGIKPSAAVLEQLRETKYWTAFNRIAHIHGWDISWNSTQTPEQRSAIALQIEKMKRRHRL